MRLVVPTSKFVVCRNYCIFVPSFTKCFSILTRESSRKMHKSWIDMTVDSTSFLFLANRKIIRSHTYNTPWNLIPHICYFRQVWRHNCRRRPAKFSGFVTHSALKKKKDIIQLQCVRRTKSNFPSDKKKFQQFLHPLCR